MKKTISLFAILLIFISTICSAQHYAEQYFDNNPSPFADTIQYSLSADTNNVWKVGKPNKSYFKEGLSKPNVLITELDSSYGNNLNSSVIFKAYTYDMEFYRSYAFTWSQKFDLEIEKDIAAIDFSFNGGFIWSNVFDSTNFWGYYINFYGFDYTQLNQYKGIKGFTGLDTNWRDLWLCFSNWSSTSYYPDSILVRFTLKSDSVDSNNEGWMIDNMNARASIVHTVDSDLKPKDKFIVFPNVTTGIFHVESTYEYGSKNKINEISIYDSDGKLIKYNNQKVKRATFDLTDYTDGVYYIDIKYPKGIERQKLILRK